MLITRTSLISGVERTMDLPVTQSQLDAYAAGGLAQNVFHNLTPDQREFIMSGITAGEWNLMYPADDEDTMEEDFWEYWDDDRAF